VIAGRARRPLSQALWRFRIAKPITGNRGQHPRQWRAGLGAQPRPPGI